jgi:hypothetical protein
VTSARGLQAYALSHGLVVVRRETARTVPEPPGRLTGAVGVARALIAWLSRGRLTDAHDELLYVIRKPEDRFARLVLAAGLPALAGPATMKAETASRRQNQHTAWHRRVITPRTLTLRPRTQPDPPYGYTAKDVRGRQHEPRAGGRAAQDGVSHACGPADPRT